MNEKFHERDEMTNTDYRLVPMSREMRERKMTSDGDMRTLLGEIFYAYDNAPADPREAIAKALYPITWDDLPRLDSDEVDLILRALGLETP